MAAVPKLAHKGFLSGLFEDGESAENAYQTCLDLGYAIGDVNVIVAEGTRQRLLKDEEDIKARLAGHTAEGGELGAHPAGVPASCWRLPRPLEPRSPSLQSASLRGPWPLH